MPRFEPKRRAFTLTELVVSMTIMSVLAGAGASAMILASRAIPDESSPLSTIREAGALQAEIAAELRYAITFTEASEHALDFQVPDRNHGLPGSERIRYEWSGTPGDPLLRQYNSGQWVSVADGVQDFSLTYSIESVDQTQTPESDSAETTLISYTAAVPSDYDVDSIHWIGAYFRPSFASDVVSWTVTKIRLRAKSNGLALGSNLVQIRAATSDHKPDVNVLDEATLSEASLGPSYLWSTSSFSKVTGINPKQGLCVVVKHAADSKSASVEWQDKGALSPVTHRVDTGNAGDSWSADTDRTMSLVVLGTVKTRESPTTVATQYLEAVGVKLRLGKEALTRVETAAQIVNRPDVTGL